MNLSQNIRSISYRESAIRSRIQNPEERGEPLSLEQAAEFLGLKPSTVRQKTGKGEIPGYKQFRRVVWYRKELEIFRDFITVRI